MLQAAAHVSRVLARAGSRWPRNCVKFYSCDKDGPVVLLTLHSKDGSSAGPAKTFQQVLRWVDILSCFSFVRSFVRSLKKPIRYIFCTRAIRLCPGRTAGGLLHPSVP